MSNELINIQDRTDLFGLPRLLVQGIIMAESGNNPWAYRAEPAYRYLYDVELNVPFRTINQNEIDSAEAPDDFPYMDEISSRDTEWFGQQSSWGPMQIMGAVARERGYTDFFPALCSFDEGVHWGCSHLKWLCDRYKSDDGWTGVISAYNQGSPRRNEDGTFCNQVYVNKVLLSMESVAIDTGILAEIKNAQAA